MPRRTRKSPPHCSTKQAIGAGAWYLPPAAAQDRLGRHVPGPEWLPCPPVIFTSRSRAARAGSACRPTLAPRAGSPDLAGVILAASCARRRADPVHADHHPAHVLHVDHAARRPSVPARPRRNAARPHDPVAAPLLHDVRRAHLRTPRSSWRAPSPLPDLRGGLTPLSSARRRCADQSSPPPTTVARRRREDRDEDRREHPWGRDCDHPSVSVNE